MKRTLLIGTASLLCALPSSANLIGVDITGTLTGDGTYEASGPATVGAGVEYSTPIDSDGLLSLDLQGVDGHDVLVSYTLPSSGQPLFLDVEFSLANLIWNGGTGTIVGFAFVESTGGAAPFGQSFTASTVSGTVSFFGSGTALYRIEPMEDDATGVPDEGGTVLLLGLGLAGILVRSSASRK